MRLLVRGDAVTSCTATLVVRVVGVEEEEEEEEESVEVMVDEEVTVEVLLEEVLELLLVELAVELEVLLVLDEEEEVVRPAPEPPGVPAPPRAAASVNLQL